ncbi:MAG TPA: ABC transporter permease [Alphaproteobacteria bacterium]|nr:ABC transporter permease [Alphaproteobacteria bacterium]
MDSTAPPEERFLASPARSRRGLQQVQALLLHAGALGFLLVAWAIFTWVNQSWELVNPILLPTPLEVAESGYELLRQGVLLQYCWVSLGRVVKGFGLAAIAALSLGLLIGMSTLLRSLIEPIVEFLRPIPPLAFLPMFLVWFGLGESSKVAFIAYTTFFPMFVAIAAGVMQVDIALLRAAASLGATRWQLIRHVVLPSAFSGIIVGLRVGFSLAIFVIVGAEFMGADSGLGYMIVEGRDFFLPAQIVLGALILGFLGFLVNAFLLRLEGYVLRWRTAQS